MGFALGDLKRRSENGCQKPVLMGYVVDLSTVFGKQGALPCMRTFREGYGGRERSNSGWQFNQVTFEMSYHPEII